MSTSNIQAFALRCIEKFGNKFDYTESIYTTYKKPITIKCRLHGEFQTTPVQHIEADHGKCEGCRLDYLFNIFKNKVIKKFGNQFSFEKTVYTNNYKDKILLTCIEHGDFITSADNLLKSEYGCSECASKLRIKYKFKTPEEAIKELLKIHNSYYTYPNLNTVRRQDKIEVVCQYHGSFYPEMSSHLLGSGCNDCMQAKNQAKNRRSLEEFIRLSKEVHNNFYTYEEAVYTNSTTPLKITCPIHGVFEQRPDCHYNRKRGCSNCSRSTRELEIYNLVSNISSDTIQSYRPKWMKGKELDIFVPSLNLAIEYNGNVYHHSSTNSDSDFLNATYKDSQYHSDKYLTCLENSIDLLHIFEFEDFDLKVNELLSYIENPSNYRIIFENNKRTHNNLEFYGESFIQSK